MQNVKADDVLESPFVPPRWIGAASIDRAQEFNVQWIGWLCLRAIDNSGSVTAPFLVRNRDLWSRIDVEAQKRAAGFPFVIVDLRLLQAADTARIAPRESCEDLLLDTILTAQQVAENDRTTAQMMFGMNAAAATSFASMGVPQARKLARTQQPRFRWENDPQFWRDWLLACWKADLPAMELLRYRAIRHLCADLSEV